MFANAETFAPLASPATVPLTIDRRIESIADESGASRVVVRETIRQRAGDLFDTTQQNQYVMNRRTLLNVADSRAYAFDPGNIVDRSGSYRLQLPFDTPSGATLTLYQNEIGATYPFAGTGVVSEVEGLTLHEFAAVAGPMPIDDAYLAELQKAMPVPVSLTLDQLKPHLAALGIDVDALLAALAPALTPADRETLLSLAGAPIPVEYVLSVQGSAGVDQETGTEVDVHDVVETLAVRPTAVALANLTALLDRYPQVAAASAASEALSKVTAEPIPVAEYRYSQTPASVHDVAAMVKEQRQAIFLAERGIPVGMAIVGLVLFGVGFYGWLRHRDSGEPRPHRVVREHAGTSDAARISALHETRR
jgi:hypothetical protein